MGNRREFLRLAAAGAMWPAARAWAQKSKKPEGIFVNDVHGQLSGTYVHRIVQPESLDGVRAALKSAASDKRALCIAGGRHSMGSQAFATDGVLIDTRKLTRVLAFDGERGLVEVEAGIEWPELLEALNFAQPGERKWGFNQKQTGADRLTLGGSLAANAHGRGLTLPPIIGDVEAIKLVDARGRLHNCSRTENAELFSLAIGGYGLFGFIYSVTLRLVPRRLLERVVELRSVEGLMHAFDERIAEGFLYGDFQYAIDEASPDFLRRGVFSCYRPADASRTATPTQRELSEKDWTELLYLAHADKSEAFKRYADYYVSTNGQLYWSDEHQMSIYPENYHRTIDQRMGAANRATEVITEIYCERDALESFMAAVRAYAVAQRTEIVYGTVRLIEEDRESFLAWAKKPYACVIFNLHVERTSSAVIRASDAFRALIDIGLRHGGSYYPTYHRYALKRQVEAAFPQFEQFLKLKRKYDPGELFQSDWYRHYKKMFFG
ncbi:MAG: FAD-dependent oxidoreductase [Burkholderiales bacterium]